MSYQNQLKSIICAILWYRIILFNRSVRDRATRDEDVTGMNMEKASELIQKRRDKFDALRRSNIQLFPNDFKFSHTIDQIQGLIERQPETIKDDAPVFAVAGRVMAINRFGKAAFIRFRDRTGQLQAYIRKDKIGDEAFSLFKQVDVGDFVGLSGGVF